MAKGRGVLEREVVGLVERTLGDCLGGGFEVEVAIDGFRRADVGGAEDRSLGHDGRVLVVSFDGWGTAFEARRIRARIVVDLDRRRDEFVDSVMEQTRSLVANQLRQRARALAADVLRPLDEEGFADFRRLSVDVAVAVGVVRHYGSESSAAQGLRLGLRDFFRTRRANPHALPVRVHGLTLTIPFLLEPFAITSRTVPSAGRPLWLDDGIGLLASDVGRHSDPASLLADMLLRTPLKGRSVSDDGTWPPEALMDLAMRLGSVPNAEDVAAPPPLERRFVVERRLVGMDEIFG